MDQKYEVFPQIFTRFKENRLSSCCLIKVKQKTPNIETLKKVSNSWSRTESLFCLCTSLRGIMTCSFCIINKQTNCLTETTRSGSSNGASNGASQLNL